MQSSNRLYCGPVLSPGERPELDSGQTGPVRSGKQGRMKNRVFHPFPRVIFRCLSCPYFFLMRLT